MIKKVHIYLVIFIILILSFLGYLINVSGLFDKKENDLYIDKDNGFAFVMPDGIKASREKNGVVLKSKREEVLSIRAYGSFEEFKSKSCAERSECTVSERQEFQNLIGISGEVVYFESNMKDSADSAVSYRSGPYFLVSIGGERIIAVEPPEDLDIGEVDTVLMRKVAETIESAD